METFAGEYFDEIVVGVSATLILLLLVQILLYFKNVKNPKNSQIIKGHIPHWIFSLTLLVFLLLEFIERLMMLSTADRQRHDMLRLSSCLLSVVLVLLSLASYHVSEKKSKRLNILGLLWLWIFLGVVYLIKATEKTYMSSWQSCPLQMRMLVEIFIAANSFVLLVIDTVAFVAMGLKMTAQMVPCLEGVEFVHECCCFLSKVTYHWVSKILLKGFKRPLELEDLGNQPKTEDVETYYKALKAQIEKEKALSWEKKGDFSMFRCIWNVSKSIIVFTGFLQLTAEMMLFIAPMCLDLIINSLDDDVHNATRSESNSTSMSPLSDSVSYLSNVTTDFANLDVCPLSARSFLSNPYVLTVLLLMSYLVQVPVKKYHDFIAVREAIRLKSAIQACIFDKSLSLKMSRVNEGKFANHMAVDATQLVNFSFSCHYAWSLPILVLTCLLLLFFQLGKAGAIGCLLVFILVPVQYLLGRYLGQRQDQIMDTADKRLLKTNEMLEHIKLLKMYGWEDLFCQRVVDIRSKEISTMWKTSIARVIAAFITDGIPSFACIFTFVLYYFMESTPLKLGKVFSSTVIFMILANQLFFVAYIIVGAIKTRTAMLRLTDYFVLPQIFQKDPEEEPENMTDKRSDTMVLLKSSNNGTMNNKSSNSMEAVENIQLPSLPESTNLAVEGGDDTMDLTDEVAVIEGVIKIVDGTFAWHESPVLNNINLILPKGKLTMMLGSVGSGKSSLLWAILGEMEKLKGTQEFCELPLALVPQRAWIMNASIRDNIIFGLPFDETLYNEVISSCTLDTDFKLFPDGDATEIGEKGANLSGGQKQRVGLARALYQNADVYLLDDCLSALDPQVAATIFDKVVLKRLLKRGKTAFFVTHNTNLLKHADNLVIMTAGSIIYQGHPNLCPAPIISHMRADLEQDTQQNKDHSAAEKLKKVQQSSILPDKFRIASLSSTSLNFVKPELERDPPHEGGVAKLVMEEERQMGATPLYFPLQYLKHAGLHLVVMAVILYGFRQGFKIVGDYYLGIFIENSDIGRLDMYYLISFCVCTCTSILLIPVSVLAVEKFCLNASKNIHNKIIHSLSTAPMRFFDTTPLGRILNRMSADLNIVDLVLNAHFDCFLFLLTFVVGSIFINGCFNPFFIIPAIPILVVSVLLQRFFIASCRELQRLDCITKSQILSHFSQILSGLHIIRTSGCEARFKKENFEHVNRNSLPLLFQYVCTAWMAYRLDLLGALIVFISFISSLIAHSKGYMDANAAGVAMLYAVCNSYFLHWAMKYLSDLEIYTSNIQRLVEYCDLKSEGDNEDKKPHPPPEWPTTGDLQFRDVSLTYDKSLKPVIQDLDLNFPSGYKVGICGRTGSGKSTLTLGLFRLVDICKGEIVLDNLDVSSVPIKDLRKSLSIIPQDPVIFAGNIRFNLDPLGLKTDEDLWTALKVSQLHELIFNLPQKMETEISSGGCSLSIGEKQLLCLARALLRNSKVLVMDEATASIDQRTDQVIQNIIKSAFKDRTVLTVAHRISTIIHSDWVVVMQGGQLIEEGSPQELLKKNTNFASMVNSS